MGLEGLRARATQRAIDAGGEGLSGESVRTVSTFRGAAGYGGGLLHFVVVRIFGVVFSCEDEHARELTSCQCCGDLLLLAFATTHFTSVRCSGPSVPALADGPRTSH